MQLLSLISCTKRWASSTILTLSLSETVLESPGFTSPSCFVRSDKQNKRYSTADTEAKIQIFDVKFSSCETAILHHFSRHFRKLPKHTCRNLECSYSNVNTHIPSVAVRRTSASERRSSAIRLVPFTSCKMFSTSDKAPWLCKGDKVNYFQTFLITRFDSLVSLCGFCAPERKQFCYQNSFIQGAIGLTDSKLYQTCQQNVMVHVLKFLFTSIWFDFSVSVRKTSPRCLINQLTQVVSDNIHICLQLFKPWIQMIHSSVIPPNKNLQNSREKLLRLGNTKLWSLWLENKAFKAFIHVWIRTLVSEMFASSLLSTGSEPALTLSSWCFSRASGSSIVSKSTSKASVQPSRSVSKHKKKMKHLSGKSMKLKNHLWGWMKWKFQFSQVKLIMNVGVCVTN